MSTITARKLRAAMTDAEKRLWACLRDRRMDGAKFRRQHPFDRYVLDFACIELRLCVEADGGQHADGADAIRDALLMRHGWRVLRLWNTDILGNAEGVAVEILRVVRERREELGL